MSIRVMTHVWQHSRQKGGALLVLLAIADFADDDGVAFPSLSKLADRGRLDRRQVIRVLAQLQRDGELELVKHGGFSDDGKGHANTYRVLLVPCSDKKTPRGSDKKTPRGGDICDGGVVVPVSPQPSLEPSVKQQHAREETEDAGPGAGQPALPRFAAQVLPVEAESLVRAVYRGGRRDLGVVPEKIYRRELVIAGDLLAVGASPPEAEQWAREAADDPRRREGIHLRAYERERCDWLARRRDGPPREGPALRYLDGQPPTWMQRPIAAAGGA